MGCCHDREKQLTSIKEDPPKNKRVKEHKLMRNSDAPLVTDASVTLIGNEDFGKKQLKNYIEFCKTEKRYSQLVELVSDTTTINKAKAYFEWAEKPKTIGSLALVYICQFCQKGNSEIIPYLENILPILVQNISNGTDDLRDNSLMLLYYILDFSSEEKIMELIQLEIFSVLMRSIMCSKEELRHLTAGVCYKLYKNRPYAQKIFIDMNGGRQLIQQISWSSENDTVLKSLLEYLAELMQDKDDEVMQQYIQKLNEEKASEIIRDLNNTDKSAETLETIDYLIGLFSSEDTKE